MHYFDLAIVCLFLIHYSSNIYTDAYIEELELPKEFKDCLHRAENCKSTGNVTDEDINNYCTGRLRQESAHTADLSNDVHMIYTKTNDRGRKKRHTWYSKYSRYSRHSRYSRYSRNSRCNGRAIRKEIRQLTSKEWYYFHRAMNNLKKKGIYDELAAIHRGNRTLLSAHFGPNFLGWHRVYLLLLEFYLREENPCVAIPYWDSSLDFDMKDPSESVLFTKYLVGNGDGNVTEGPFANWKTGQGQPLMRNIGAGGTLIRKQFIKQVLSRTRHSDITDNSKFEYSIEQYHNGPHVWVDGQMVLLDEASEDPIFWMHHAFIDCWWQLFIDKNSKGKRNWAYNDYPKVNGRHAPNEKMIPFGEVNPFNDKSWPFKGITNRKGYSDNIYLDYYKCQPFPSCSSKKRSCNSYYLKCDTKTWRCVSKTAEEFESTKSKSSRTNYKLRRKLWRQKLWRKFFLPKGRKIKSRFSDKRDSRQKIRQKWLRLKNSPSFTKLKLSFIRKLLTRRHKRSLRRYQYRKFVNHTNSDHESDPSASQFKTQNAVRSIESFSCRNIYNRQQPMYPDNIISNQITERNSFYLPVAIFINSIHHYRVNSKYSALFVQVNDLTDERNYKVPIIFRNSHNATTATDWIAIKKTESTNIKAYLSAFTLNGKRCKVQCYVQNSHPARFKYCTGGISINNVGKEFYDIWQVDIPIKLKYYSLKNLKINRPFLRFVC